MPEGCTSGRVRLLWALVTVAAMVLAVASWVGGSTLRIRYLGCWCSFGAVLTGVAAVTGSKDTALCATVVIAAVAVGAGLGALRGLFER